MQTCISNLPATTSKVDNSLRPWRFFKSNWIDIAHDALTKFQPSATCQLPYVMYMKMLFFNWLIYWKLYQNNALTSNFLKLYNLFRCLQKHNYHSITLWCQHVAKTSKHGYQNLWTHYNIRLLLNDIRKLFTWHQKTDYSDIRKLTIETSENCLHDIRKPLSDIRKLSSDIRKLSSDIRKLSRDIRKTLNDIRKLSSDIRKLSIYI